MVSIDYDPTDYFTVVMCGVAIMNTLHVMGVI